MAARNPPPVKIGTWQSMNQPAWVTCEAHGDIYDGMCLYNPREAFAGPSEWYCPQCVAEVVRTSLPNLWRKDR